MVKALVESEIVRINVRDDAQEAEVRRLLNDTPLERIEFFHIPTNEPWCRDHGPIFLKRRENPKIAAVSFGFNAWGYKLSPFEDDDAAAALMASKLGVRVFRFRGIRPGRRINRGERARHSADHRSHACLIPIATPICPASKSKRICANALGVTQILWLGDGIEGDDTDGHVDDITRFVSPNTVVTVVEEDEDDPNYEPLELNLQRLRTMRLSNGSPTARPETSHALAHRP